MSRYEAIWKTICRIPYGKVATYGQIARLAGMEGQSRLVGYALHALKPDQAVPWHRVINAQGRISLVGPSERRQRKMLESEGVRFTAARRVNLRLFQWQPVFETAKDAKIAK
ncbi:MAG TPA: MGMT family protein, partial [Acidobacteriota bacterium]|nr:MGMT family protein [Acidobacteriota bacterium]